MVASVQSPADLVNLSLARIGYKGRIGTLYEGSMAAKLALSVYAQTRDQLLRGGGWDFSDRTSVMTLVRQAPAGGYVPAITPWTEAYPPLPWAFEYIYPDDCLEVRAVKPAPIFIPDYDPQPHTFAINYNATDPIKTILCNVPSAIIVYTAQVTNPLAWEPDFVEAFAAALGRRLAPSLMGMEAAKLAASDEANASATGEDEQG